MEPVCLKQCHYPLSCLSILFGHFLTSCKTTLRSDFSLRSSFFLYACSANCYYKMPVLAHIVLMEMPVGLGKHYYKTGSFAAIKQSTSRELHLPLIGSLRNWWGHLHIAKTDHNCRELLWHHQYTLLGSRACKIVKLRLYTG